MLFLLFASCPELIKGVVYRMCEQPLAGYQQGASGGQNVDGSVKKMFAPCARAEPVGRFHGVTAVVPELTQWKVMAMESHLFAPPRRLAKLGDGPVKAQ
jgi:hypothetical protein